MSASPAISRVSGAAVHTAACRHSTRKPVTGRMAVSHGPTGRAGPVRSGNGRESGSAAMGSSPAHSTASDATVRRNSMGSRARGSGVGTNVGGENGPPEGPVATGAKTSRSSGRARNRAAASQSAVGGRRSHPHRESCSARSGSERAHSQNASATSSRPSAAHTSPGSMSSTTPARYRSPTRSTATRTGRTWRG